MVKNIDQKIISLANFNDRQIAVNRTVTVLRAGGLIIFPTETTYGAGVDATNPVAVEKLLRYKSKRQGKPLSIAVTDMAMAKKYVALNNSARQLYQEFLPGPMTVVSKDLGVVAPRVASEFGTVGVRIPDYDFVLEVVRILGHPITATGANASGKKRPYQIQDILDHISERQKNLIDLIIDAGKLPPNPPSVVIDTTLSTPITVRERKTTDSQIANQKQYQLQSVSPAETRALAERLLLKQWDELVKQGLVIGLDGALGTGKTIFTQGIANFLGITEPITSPTYTYSEQYDYQRHDETGQLVHIDAWKIDQAEQLTALTVESHYKSNSVVVIEWWDQVKEWLEPLIKDKHMPFLHVSFQDITDQPTVRIITVRE